ncbi:MAG: replication initiation protein [Terrimicrobiaceae bacterium]
MVRKSNHIIEASYRLSLIEQKLIAFLVSTIRPADEDFKFYRLQIKDFLTLADGTQKNYEWLADAIINLKAKNLRITYDADDGVKMTIDTSWISAAGHREGGDFIDLRFDPSLKPFLLGLKSRFTKYQLKNVIRLKSQYAIRIYELLKQYETIGYRTFEYAELREILGIAHEQYSLFADFRRYVLLVAQTEIKKRTDIFFIFEEIRLGRAVSKIKFSIFHKTALQAEKDILSLSGETMTDCEKLLALVPDQLRGLPGIKRLLAEWLTRGGFDFVSRNIKYTNARADVGHGGRYRNYLSKALTKDYGLAAQEDAESAAKADSVLIQKARAAEEATRMAAETIRADQARIEKARDIISALSPEEWGNLRTRAIEGLSPAERDLIDRRSAGAGLILRMAMERLVTPHCPFTNHDKAQSGQV